MSDSTTRFSNRVENYVKWRPSYPDGVIDMLREACGLKPDWAISDIGSGPGNLTRLLLEFGAEVYGVEPNRDMREAGETLLAGHSRFHSIDGTAESTGLPDASVQLVTAGQAFHWFDRDRSKREFERILTRPKWVALVWNFREGDTPFFVDYERLSRTYSIDFDQVTARGEATEAAIESFFSPGVVKRFTLSNNQALDLTGLRGRIESSSYMLTPEHPDYGKMITAIETLFAEHAVDGALSFHYETRLYVGQLAD